MEPHPPPVATIAHSELRAFLQQQPWRCWSVDSARFDALAPHQPVALNTLLRVLKSHYTFSDLYVFWPLSTEAQVAQIDWRQIQSTDTQGLIAYVIARAAGKPLLGLAGSLDEALRGEIFLLIPTDNKGARSF